MKALVATDYGPPATFTVADLPIPRPGDGQVQIRVAAAALNPGDLALPRGDLRSMIELTFPHVLGNDFAGTVTEVGDGVTGFAVGDEVFGHAVPRVMRPLAATDRPALGTGTLAEYVVVEAGTPFLAHRPATLPAADAAALATSGLTARAVSITAGVAAGETVLVVGASGGMGTALIPLLAAAGAKVIATGAPDDEAVLRELGAAEVIGYGDYPAGADVAVNFAVPGTELGPIAGALRPGGRLYTVTFPVPRPEWIGRDDISCQVVLDKDASLGGMAEVAADAVAGRLRPYLAASYPLTDGVRAYTDLAGRHTLGKRVIRCEE
ncbi:NADP-dependent oxidoreductase [Actinoplanes awajinensis]|uniref:Alcohol dehydrogenase n=1 Tax=Actinoplanes awajinensis subsp. mycoplanecinus TaxID=135947 RepID=A0A101JQM7_9ACTN|nr:NADP-dependent oxidoreductase [Actinoplanes awajinensis]KUL31247.1 alcohol dehydrogenase [Actinoplanes awajinensis subsp. mycoplanecinus]